MEIKTKFNVGDLVQDKYSVPRVKDREVLAHEVLEVHTQSCYAGTQVFYDVICIHALTDDKYSINPKQEVTQVFINHKQSDEKPWRIREDMLLPCSEDIVKIITEFSKQKDK